MNHCYLLVLLCLFGACSAPPAPLVVKQFTMKDFKMNTEIEAMVLSEKQRHLFGAVSTAEFKARIGSYYTIIWNDPQGRGTGEVEILFEYQQGATASQVKRMVRHFKSDESSGKTEFAIIGKDYYKNGRVLAWKTTLTRGKRIIASRQSHLWQ